MKSVYVRRNSFISLVALLALAIVLGISANAADKKAAPGSVFVAAARPVEQPLGSRAGLPAGEERSGGQHR